MRLTKPQKNIIARWCQKGYKTSSIKSGYESHILTTMEKRRYYEYPESCPYANWWLETHEIKLDINKVGKEKIVEEFRYVEYWHCNWPKTRPKEPITKIYAGTHPLIPVRELRQLELLL